MSPNVSMVTLLLAFLNGTGPSTVYGSVGESVSLLAKLKCEGECVLSCGSDGGCVYLVEVMVDVCILWKWVDVCLVEVCVSCGCAEI